MFLHFLRLKSTQSGPSLQKVCENGIRVPHSNFTLKPNLEVKFGLNARKIEFEGENRVSLKTHKKACLLSDVLRMKGFSVISEFVPFGIKVNGHWPTSQFRLLDVFFYF